MAFLESPRFPDSVQYRTSEGLSFLTNIGVNQSGHELRIKKRANPIREYIINNVKRQSDLETILEYYYSSYGAFDGFRFKDWSDYKSCDKAATVAFTDQTLGTGTGSDPTWQCIKLYKPTGASNSYTRTISKLVSGTVLVGVNGVQQTETTNYTVNYNTGLITFVTPPTLGHSITAGFEFDVPVRFRDDAINYTFTDRDIFTFQLPLIELLV